MPRKKDKIDLSNPLKRASQAGLETATHCLLDTCSTTELPRQ